MKLEFSVPLYMKIKKDKLTLIGLNWYRNAHFTELNKVKKAYAHYIKTQLLDNTIKFNKYKIYINLYYKNTLSDLDNSTSVILKFVNDALQKEGIIENDNLKFFNAYSAFVAGMDKNNPRLEIIIEGI